MFNNTIQFSFILEESGEICTEHFGVKFNYHFSHLSSYFSEKIKFFFSFKNTIRGGLFENHSIVSFQRGKRGTSPYSYFSSIGTNFSRNDFQSSV